MNNIIKISNASLKNILNSKLVLIGVILCIFYSLLWIQVISPQSYIYSDYIFEFNRLFYVLILYCSSLVITQDIQFNTTKILFTGIFSRKLIIVSKAISLIGLGVVFTLIAEINALLLYMFGFVNMDYFFLNSLVNNLITFVVLTFSVGSMIILIMTVVFGCVKNYV